MERISLKEKLGSSLRERLRSSRQQDNRQASTEVTQESPAPATQGPVLYDRFRQGIKKTIQVKEDQAVERAREEDQYMADEIEDDIRHRTRRPLVRTIWEELNQLQLFVKTEYPEVWIKPSWTPPKWLREGQIKMGKTSVNIGARLKKTKFYDIYGYLNGHVLPSWEDKTKEIIRRAGGYCWKDSYPAKPGDSEDLIVMPDIGRMSKELQISKSTAEKYLRAFTEIGILKKLNRIGKGGKIVYKIGWRKGWVNPKTGASGPRSLYFLKNTREIKEKLATFTVQRG